ncbi:hypothetical protein D3C87_2044590 [compost metagenome]
MGADAVDQDTQRHHGECQVGTQGCHRRGQPMVENIEQVKKAADPANAEPADQQSLPTVEQTTPGYEHDAHGANQAKQ